MPYRVARRLIRPLNAPSPVPIASPTMLKNLRFHLSRVSTNSKTGPIPVSTSSQATCPPTCPFLGSGCYAQNHGLNFHWRAVTEGTRGVTASEFFRLIAALPSGQFWRANQAGDLPHTLGRVSRRFLRGLIAANHGRRGYTYTHHRLEIGENLALIRQANRQGFTINVSTETEAAADRAVAAGLPAVVAVPSTETRTAWNTPAGHRVVVCPAQREGSTMDCATCQLCYQRPAGLVVAFLAHGTSKAKANAAIAGVSA